MGGSFGKSSLIDIIMGDTRSIFSYTGGDEKGAMKVFNSGKYILYETDGYGNTSLMLACKYCMGQLAIQLIKSGMSMPDKINNFGKTALIYACNNNLKAINSFQDSDGTFWIAGFQHIANKIYENDHKTRYKEEKKLDNKMMKQNKYNDECNNKRTNTMIDVALLLIETENVNVHQIDSSGCTALTYARMNNMQPVVDVLQKLGVPDLLPPPPPPPSPPSPKHQCNRSHNSSSSGSSGPGFTTGVVAGVVAGGLLL